MLYGRRRVGKTALLRQACAGRRTVFFTADLGSRSDQLRGFASRLAGDLGETEWEDVSFPTWEAALRVVVARAGQAPLVLVLDEFQHLVQADPTLPSVLQRLWDGEISSSRLAIVLCGSYVSFMERQVLGARNPLYGRRTGQLLLEPLRIRDAARFFPGWKADDRMRAVSILGGIPAYLQRFDPELAIEDNVERAILGLGAPLYDEPRFLMMEELREPHLYFSICRAIAHGNNRPNEIAQSSGATSGAAIQPYLSSLRDLRFIERRVPVTVRNPERSRRGLYRLRDPFLQFWFRFVLPNRTALEAGDAALVWTRKIAPALVHHVAGVFEDAAREHLLARNRAGELPAVYDRIGGWWRGRDELDVVAVADDGPLLLAECKWTTRRLGVDVLRRLEERLPVLKKDLDRPPSRVDLALVSRSGFTPELRKIAREREILLFTVKDLV